jgi:ell wall binding domain 2 (CWB2)/Fibronectin type III domain/Carboxypeptidase regulatory-like domain
VVLPSSAAGAEPPPNPHQVANSSAADQAQARAHDAALSHKPLALDHGQLVNPADVGAATKQSSSLPRALQSAGSAFPQFATSSGSISGTITAAAGGAAINNVCAEVFAASDTYNPVTSACTDATGHYAATTIPNGQYVVEFVDGDTTRTDVPQWYNGKPDSGSADLIVVNSADVPNVNAVMVVGGWVTGTVTDSTGAAVAGACVSIWDPTIGNYGGGYNTGGYVEYSTCTDNNGVYRSAGLPAGNNYQVVFDQWGSGNYLEQWYNNQPSQATANSVPVTLGAGTANIDATLVTGGSVSGTVNDSSGSAPAPVTNASVQLYDATTGGYVSGGWGYTDSSGAYQTLGVPAGNYKVEFTPPSGSSDQGQWYNNKPDQASANTVTVGVGQPVTGVDAMLTSGGTITGTVTDSSTLLPLAGICVQAIGTTGYSYPAYYESVCSDSAGTYTINGLPADDYTVEFHGTNHNGKATAAYLSQTYLNQIGQYSGGLVPVPVTVASGGTTSGIDDKAVLGATFSGTVTDSVTGAPVSNICVIPNDTTSSYYSGADLSCTDSSGNYTTPGVPTGSYKLDFLNLQGRYIEQWYNNKPDQSTAQALSVTQGSNYPSNNAAMQLGGNITGTVTAAVGGGALANICVTLYHLDGTYGGNGGCTDSAGYFTSSAVAAGTYKVGFYDYSGAYSSQYYNGKSTLALANTVSVTTGGTAAGIDAALAATSVAGAPTGVSATAGDGEATVVFSAPTSDGGSPITGYTITPTPACSTTCTGLTTSSLSSTVAGLTNGTAYTFTVNAINSVGTGPESAASAAVTPVLTSGGGTVVAPGAPTNVSASVNVSTVTLAYTAPASDGGATITGYTITSSPTCSACTGLTPSGTSSTVTGLTNGTAYTFTAKATNSAGTSVASLPSNAVTPSAAAISPVSASTTDPNVPATVTNNGTTATGSTGTGTVTVSQYPSNPTAAATFPSAGSFLDVSTSSGSTFTTVVIKDCNLHGGASLEWWNPAANAGAGAWQPVVGDPTDTSGLPGCLTVTLDATSSPTVSELGGTIFGVVATVPDAPTGATATAGNGQSTVSFTTPASDGGSAITGYTITPSPACSACTGTTPTGTSSTVAGLTNGTAYTFTVKATNSAGTGAASAASNSVTPTAPTPTTTPPPGTNLGTVTRLAGLDRFGTAAAISKAEFPNGHAGAVVLARGDEYPDALVAAPLAAAKNAPLLLTVGTSLPAVSKTELQRVLPTGGTVYILGGTGAVPASVASELKDLGYQIVRYGGADRFATAVKVADALGDPTTVLLATGTNFPDALSAGVAAAKAGGIVLLTNGATLPSATSSYLSAHGKTVDAIGGPAAQADNKATGLVGSDRYATSVAVAEKFFTGPSSVGVASGMAFPDALSGGALLAHAGVPLVLSASGSLPNPVGVYLSSVKSSVGSTYLFGGSGALAVAVQTAVGSALGL